MYITVEDALTIYPLSEGKLTAGRKGLHRIVKSVNVMDAPDISDWVREGDILFTTAYLMKDEPTEGIKLLRKLAEKGAAGLGIKLGRFWSSVPEDMLAEADRIGFPLIELPFPFTFSDQMRGLFNAELQKSTRMLHGVLEKQKELIRFALAPDGTGEMFKRIGGILESPLAVVGLRGQILFSNLEGGDLALLQNRPNKRIIPSIRTEGGDKLLCIPLKSAAAGDEGLGYAAFHTRGGIPLKEEEGLFHQAAEIISHHLNTLEREHMEQSTQNEFASLLKNYLKQQVSIETLLECAVRLSIPFGTSPYYGVLTSLSEADRTKQERIFRTIRQELQYHPLLKDLSQLHVPIEGAMLSIYPSGAHTDGGKLANLLTRIFTDIAAESDESLRITVSQVKHKPEHLGKAYQECLDAKETAERLRVQPFVVEFGAVEMAYIFESVPKEKMRRFVDMTLSPLIDKAPDSAQELLRTLELYIEHNGQINETAKQLFIHRNTAAYRLEKIGELLQVDFKSYPHLLKLKLVLLFKRILDLR
ncbi:PucR family transcriptional regulator ligand-binding domain-containing protein [Paenibacillus filicis]|uniref:PucR family transcriptional regulator ligand-binding domain-containing protein n=1 Tax=Paenibacillus filicis TaxID=669464 RepID=A0ABU9DIS6_9BACL